MFSHILASLFVIICHVMTTIVEAGHRNSKLSLILQLKMESIIVISQ
jgi:hypothetical protein